MRMKLARALVFAIWLYSLLAFLYVFFRIIFNSHAVGPWDPVFGWIPYLTFWRMGVITFISGFASLVIYITVWGLPCDERRK